ncbi:Serine/threonine protein phosphatase [Phaffia rhodozyma]|uniref:Protein phosphatase n=1 Tax=Phaffia rhodozyma TaxID=264483 RepID=A0A0F7SU59_PHARH|nr:Serine/threonine protein phosphatase [Phaffia rhodozyma]
MFRPPLVFPFSVPRSSTLTSLPILFRYFSSPPPSSTSPNPARTLKDSPNFTFEIGLSFAGKPRRRGEQIPRGISSGGEKGEWRERMINWTEGSSEFNGETSSGKVGEVRVKKDKKDAGEDFFMIHERPADQLTTLAVADGVGGWAESGVDPSVFSQALMYHAWKAAQGDVSAQPKDILQKAYDGVKVDAEVKAGSATACVLQLDGSDGKLTSANLGDSGYLVIRKNNEFLDVPGAQQHYFNCPRQLAKVPHRRGYETNITDLPRDADLFEVQLEDGDVVILFTDGLGDNVHNSEVLLLLAQAQIETPPPSPKFGVTASKKLSVAQKLADGLKTYGQVCMGSTEKVSPFTLAAAKEGLNFRGGKTDDITVIAVRVKKNQQTSA